MNIKAAQNSTVSTTNNTKPSTKKPQVVIVGGGFGGLQAAKKLGISPLKSPSSTTTTFICFNRCYIKFRRAVSSRITTPLRAIFHQKANIGVLMAKVTGIDIEKQQVVMDDNQSLSYDYPDCSHRSREQLLRASRVRRSLLQA